MVKYYETRQEALDNRYYGGRIYYAAEPQRYYVVNQKRTIKQRIITYFQKLFANYTK